MDHPFLYELFVALAKDSRWPMLGIGDYLLLMELLEKGNYRIGSFDDMVRVCEVLWMKSPLQKPHFAAVFRSRKEAIGSFIEALKSAEQAATLPKKGDEVPVGPDKVAPPENTTVMNPGQSDAVIPPVTPPPEDIKIKKDIPITDEEGTMEVTIGSDDGTVADPTYRLPVGNPILPLSTAFLLNREYYPVPSRVLQQDWRKLVRRQQGLRREGIDITHTIKNIAREGIFLDIEQPYATENRLSLYIFIDRGPGMDTFLSFGKELAQSARDSLVHIHSQPWFFTEAPLKDKEESNGFILMNEDQSRSTNTLRLFMPSTRQNRVVLIYSDGGVVRGPEAGDQQLQRLRPFLSYLLKKTAYVAWLNPTPAHRWEGTRAGTIVREFEQIPMYEATRQGLGMALSSLKGRLTFKTMGTNVTKGDQFVPTERG